MQAIKDSGGTVSAKEIIKQLVTGQETVVRTAREELPIAEKAGDHADGGSALCADGSA